MEFLTDYQLMASFFTLAALEIVLGVDNLVFIALLVDKLPKEQQQLTRTIGLSLALIMRIGLLFSLAWIMGLKEPLFSAFDMSFSGKDLLMLAGGLFLLYKATVSIHEEIGHEEQKALKNYKGGFYAIIAQIVVIDFIFSFDSVITAVGLTENIPVIIAAMTVAMVVMIFASGVVSRFITTYPTLKMLALSFIMMIGVFLVAEGLGFHVPKGYIYFAMGFSLGVEMLNIIVKRKKSVK